MHPSEDPKLAELARFSEELAGQTGRVLHLLHLHLMQPGAGVWFQEQQVEPTIPPWPEGDDADPLEQPFGPLADQMRLLTPDELAELRRGGAPTGVASQPDLTRPGDQGTWKPGIPSSEWPCRMTWRMADNTWKRIGNEIPPCGQLWIFDFDYLKRVPGCGGLNYARDYRATLLRAYAEAFRCCRERGAECPNARMWILGTHWGCVIDAGFPTLNIVFKFAVACIAA
jgi:hypothetical protein